MDVRSDIIDVTFQLIMEKGFTDVSLNCVLTRVDITKGGFYYYFKNKDELMLEVLSKYFFRNINDCLVAIESHPGNAREKLEMFFGAAVHYRASLQAADIDLREYCLILMEGIKKYSILAERCLDFHTNIRLILGNILYQGKVEGLINEDIEPDQMAMHIMTCLGGTLLFWVINPSLNLEQITSNSFDYLWKSLNK